MNTHDDFDTERRATRTTLQELVAAVDEYSDSTAETIHVIRHMLLSRRVSFDGRPQRLKLDS